MKHLERGYAHGEIHMRNGIRCMKGNFPLFKGSWVTWALFESYEDVIRNE